MDLPTKEQVTEALWSLIDGPEDWWQWGVILASVIFAIFTSLGFQLLFKKTETKFEKLVV